ncbi:MAG: DNA adenine methylase [Methanoregulaceae archaeon]|nr:DNA adenine methylase [Methanoregulaceae archaeon]
MIKYLGSKRRLIPDILTRVEALEGVNSVCDLFSGTSRVGQALKRTGRYVHANDHLAFARVLAETFVATDSHTVDYAALTDAIARLNRLPGQPGYFAQKFSEEAQFFQAENAARMDTIRQAIEKEPEELRPILLTSLMLAADRVDSTTGVQMAYLKQWAPRSFEPMVLQTPELLPGPGVATQVDALELAPNIDADLVYLDPPYNQHRYVGNYHVWETLVLNDEPETYGKANKRIDVRTRPSVFNQKRTAREALAELIGSLRCRYLLLSFNDEGYVSLPEIEAMLGAWGEFQATAIPYRRYVGASIGIHNREGEKVGQVSHLHNHEWLFVAKRSR